MKASHPSLLLHAFIGDFGIASCKEDAFGEMSPVLWGKLPEEVVELVLAHLPLRSNRRFRCVSKHWQKLLSACCRLPSLCGVSFVWPADQLGSAPSEGSGGGGSGQSVAQDGSQALHDQQPAPTAPIRLSLSFLPPRFHFWHLAGCATDHGFVVVSDINLDRPLHSSMTSFCVFNPMTGSWRELPPLTSPNLDYLISVGVEVTCFDGDGGIEVSVVCWQRRGVVPVLAGFSSHTNAWEVYEGIRNISTDLFVMERGAAYQLGYNEKEGDALLVYHLDEGLRFVPVDAVALPPQVLRNHQIFVVTHRGGVYLVVNRPTTEDMIAEIWKMLPLSEIRRTDTLSPWEQVSIIPRQMLSDRRFKLDEVKVVGNYICGP